jgi:phage tail protein X
LAGATRGVVSQILEAAGGVSYLGQAIPCLLGNR